jgi:hypothetical protein
MVPGMQQGRRRCSSKGPADQRGRMMLTGASQLNHQFGTATVVQGGRSLRIRETSRLRVARLGGLSEVNRRGGATAGESAR